MATADNCVDRRPPSRSFGANLRRNKHENTKTLVTTGYCLTVAGFADSVGFFFFIRYHLTLSLTYRNMWLTFERNRQWNAPKKSHLIPFFPSLFAVKNSRGGLGRRARSGRVQASITGFALHKTPLSHLIFFLFSILLFNYLPTIACQKANILPVSVYL